jgi:transposase InsO family protein
MAGEPQACGAHLAKRGRLWLNDGSITRLKPERKGHVWAYDFVACRTEDVRAVRMLTVIDEYTRECLAIKVARRIKSDNVIHALTELFVLDLSELSAPG